MAHTVENDNSMTNMAQWGHFSGEKNAWGMNYLTALIYCLQDKIF